MFISLLLLLQNTVQTSNRVLRTGITIRTEQTGLIFIFFVCF